MKKLSRSYLLTNEVIKAIDKAFKSKSNIKGESKNQIVSNCIITGLEVLYNIKV